MSDHVRHCTRLIWLLSYLWGVAAISGCQSVPTAEPRSLLPAGANIYQDRITIYSHQATKQTEALAFELAQLRRQIENRLQLPENSKAVHIFLFPTWEDQCEYLTTRHPNLPKRRALFVSNLGQLKIYAHQHEQLSEDLRHETTHATLHAALEEVPLWLDEGLAEYYEVPSSKHGYHHTHAKYLAAGFESGRWRPDIGRLESIQSVSRMSELDYAESWLWVHWLQDRTTAGDDLLLRCLGTHTDQPSVDSLWEELSAGKVPQELISRLLGGGRPIH